MKKFKLFDLLMVLLPIAYIIIFCVFIIPIFPTEILYFQIVSIVLLIGLPTATYFWFKKGNMGK